MLLKRHHRNIWLRVVGITLNCLALAYFSVVKTDWLVLANLLVLLIAQVFLFVRSQNTLNRELELFFDGLKSFDSTSKFTNRIQGKGFDEIYRKLDQILESFQTVRIENQQQNDYLTALVEHINIGIVSVNADGTFSIVNSAAKNLLGVSSLKSLDALEKIDVTLSNILKTVEPNEPKLISVFRSGSLMQLSVRASKIKFKSGEVKIVSFQNIKNELDESEMEGWQKLIRILTHELMNSAGPINSTISTLLDLLSEEEISSTGQVIHHSDVIADVKQGLRIVEDRSRGMVDFVTRFRNLTLIPVAKPSEVNIKSLLDSIGLLLKDELSNHNVVFSTIVSGNINASADRSMLEQILINLVKNAIEATLDSNPARIKISAWKDWVSNIYIEISDNGIGIPAELQSKIFVPFFTTRKSGTGIGLSLSRQLANAQGGSLTLSKSLVGETVFTLQVKGI